tara:strand:- start:23 stop:229 length:207 start_codon:yes stop_codon:yes gene_type:complete
LAPAKQRVGAFERLEDRRLAACDQRWIVGRGLLSDDLAALPEDTEGRGGPQLRVVAVLVRVRVTVRIR